MSIYKGVNKTKIDAISPDTIITKGEMGGKVRVMYDTYIVPATPLATTTDEIEMGNELPLGARIVDVILYNGCASRAVSVGDYESTTRYLASVTTSETDHIDLATAATGYVVDMSETLADNQIIVTPIGGPLTEADVIRIAILYTVE